jgi:hypothetical protein
LILIVCSIVLLANMFRFDFHIKCSGVPLPQLTPVVMAIGSPEVPRLRAEAEANYAQW